jgi:hypothetical protein
MKKTTRSNSKRFIVVLVHVDMEHGDVGDIIEAVGLRGRAVSRAVEAQRYRSIRRALDAAQTWSWYADIVRVVEVDPEVPIRDR